jgi:hypothetical protein
MRAVVCLHGVTANSNRQQSQLEMALAAVAKREKADLQKSQIFAIRPVLAIDIVGVKYVSNRGISLLEIR